VLGWETPVGPTASLAAYKRSRISKPFVCPLGERWSGSRVAVVHAAIFGAAAALIILAWPGQSYAADMKSTAELQKMGYKCKVDPPDTETCTKPGEPAWHCATSGRPLHAEERIQMRPAIDSNPRAAWALPHVQQKLVGRREAGASLIETAPGNGPVEGPPRCEWQPPQSDARQRVSSGDNARRHGRLFGSTRRDACVVQEPHHTRCRTLHREAANEWR